MLKIDKTHVESAQRGKAKRIQLDRGANGGLAGADMKVIETTLDFIDVNGIGGYHKENFPIVPGALYIITKTGPIIGIFHQYALFKGMRSIHWANQLRHMGNQVGDTPKIYGGMQSLHVEG